MKRLIHLTVALLILLAGLHQAAAQGTKFTYQGRFHDGGAAANGSYDLTFTLFVLDVGGAISAGPVTNSPVTVSNGLFTVGLDFGPGVFNGTAYWLQIAARTNGGGAFTDLSPRQELTPTPYAIFAASAPVAPNSINTGSIIDGQVGNDDLAANSVTSPKILDGTIVSADIANGTLTTSDLSLASVDARYVLKAGDTMAGSLTTPRLIATDGVTTSMITNSVGILSLRSRTDIELMIDNGGGAAAAFEIFNGVGSHLFILGETGNGRVFGNYSVDGNFGVATTTFDANALAQFNLPSSVSVPHVRIKSPLGNAGFGIQFVNPDETWFVGPNIGNWPDDRFNILSDSSNKGIIIAANGNVAIDSVSGPTPFTTLTVDGSIGFRSATTPAIFVYESGTANAEKPVIMHSPGFPEYGLYYADSGDRFVMKSSAADTTPSLVVDLDSNWVSIATDTPKPGYELSVNGQIVCEDLLVEDSANWPDYVFKDDYKLRPLAEVEQHIKERQHLPGIPTAAVVEKDGLRLGDMQKRMMEKIEELTLYVIDQNKRLTAQEEHIRKLQAQLQATEARR